MKPKIEIGYQVGLLTVTALTDQRKSGYTVWKCQCDCGKEIELDTRALQRGTIRDCGCQTKVKPGQRDISGQRFGKLTAISPVAGRKPGTTIWHCICDCGNEIDAPLHQLTAGYRKSCGCMRYVTPTGRKILKDYIGKRFGMLTVLSYAGKENGMHRWRCRCDCGNETIVGQTLLQTGKTKSCGCLQNTQIVENLKLYNGTSITALESVSRKIRSNNKSGCTGVYQNSRNKKWNAQITFKGKTYFLGSFKTKEEAIKARHRGEEMHEQAIEEYYLELQNQRKQKWKSSARP